VPLLIWQVIWLFVEGEVDDVEELLVPGEVVVVAVARTQGDASIAAAMAIAAIPVSCSVLVFILRRNVRPAAGIYRISEMIP
jgi:hypothetical protein